ncbi:hypothetical protein ABPG74_016553 [Tetrahymena malaccensis]
MYRQIPTVNKICQKRIIDQDQVRLESRLKNIQAQVDTSSPQTYEYGNLANKKKNQIMESQYIEIERENKILLEKITKVMSKDPQQKTVQQQQQIVHHNQMIQNKKSLNAAQRKRELVKITVENQNFLKRLKGMKSTYEQKKQIKSWSEQQEICSRISEFGATNRKLNSKSSMQSRSVPKGIQNVNENTPSQTIPASANLTYRSRQNFETTDIQPLKKRIGSGYIVNSNKLQRNLSGLSNSNSINKKVILLRKSKKIGLSYYLIEITLEDGMFKIIADDAENPTRKVLEMSESDGTKILKKYFGNSLDQMLESIWITDKIFIRGLEMFTTEESYQSKNSNNKSQSPSPHKNQYTSKTQPDEKHRLVAPIKKSASNKSLNGENTKLYNKQLSNPMQIIEQPDQESVDMSNSNLINSKLYSNNNRKVNQRSVTEEDSFDQSKEHQSLNKNDQQNKSQIHQNNEKIDEDGFNEYGDEDYDDNESENIRKIKNQEGNSHEEIQELNNSQNINNDF